VRQTSGHLDVRSVTDFWSPRPTVLPRNLFDYIYEMKKESAKFAFDWITFLIHVRRARRAHRPQLGKTEVTGRRGRRPRQLQDDLEETKGCWNLNEEELDRSA